MISDLRRAFGSLLHIITIWISGTSGLHGRTVIFGPSIYVTFALNCVPSIVLVRRSGGCIFADRDMIYGTGVWMTLLVISGPAYHGRYALEPQSLLNLQASCPR